MLDGTVLVLRTRGKKLLGQGYELFRRLGLALRGNSAAQRWIVWRTRVLLRQIQGHTTHPPGPNVP
jgi:hypothetical protein